MDRMPLRFGQSYTYYEARWKTLKAHIWFMAILSVPIGLILAVTGVVK